MAGKTRVKKTYKIAALTSHPIQYYCPLWKKLEEHPQIDLTVYFCTDFGIKERYEPEFGVTYKWDVPLLDGYKSIFLRNYSPKSSVNPIWGKINPGIISELIKNRYDGIFVHGHFATTNLLAFLTSKLIGTQVLLRAISSNFYDSRVKRSKFILLAKNIYLKILYKYFIDSFLSIGSRNRDFFKYYGVPENKIFHCPYSVDNDFFTNNANIFFKERENLRKEFGVKSDETIILFASKLIPKKDPFHLLKSYKKINNVKKKHLFIVGDGALKKEMERFVKSERLENVHFFGFQNQINMVKFYSISDVFIRTDIPQTGDWGATVNESLACSLPVIATNAISSQADLVKEGYNGHTIEVGDIEKLAFLLKNLIENPEILFKMRDNCLSVVAENSYEKDVEGIIKALSSIKTNY